MSAHSHVALITGGGKNLDENTRHELVKGVTEIAVHYNSQDTRDQVKRLCGQLKRQKATIKISIHSGDLGTAAAVEKLFHDIVAEHKRVDVVINSAGMVLKKPIAEVSGADYNRMFAYAVFVDEQRRKWVDRYTEVMQRV